MSSILGQCAECCECPAVTVERKSRSASKGKVGYAENAGYGSTPPKRYLKLSENVTNSRTQFGFGASTPAIPCCSEAYETGSTSSDRTRDREYDPDTGILTIDPAPLGYSITINGVTNYTSNSCGTCGAIDYTTSVTHSYAWDTFQCQAAFGNQGPSANFNSTTTTSATVVSIVSECDFIYNITGSPPVDACGCPQQNDYSDVRASSYTSTLSNEYTTATLISNTVAALPAYGAFSVASPSASRNLSTDELSYAVADSVYRFRFKVPKIGSGTTYIISWVERFSPEGGGAPTDTVKTYTWSGTIPGGYDAADSTTWPITSEYTLAVPATDGTTTLACIVAQCSGTAPADPCNP